MVKVGILGAQTPEAGEIVRILIHHPETEIATLHAPLLLGRNITTVHHGFIGETPLNFTDKIIPDELDLLIVTEKSDLSDKIISMYSELSDLKYVLLDPKFLPDQLNLDTDEVEIGVSEINRKALVRTGRIAWVPSPAIVPSLIALAPLAGYLLLNSDINIDVTLPEDILSSINIEEQLSYLKDALLKIQSSFSGSINLNIIPVKNQERIGLTQISMRNSLSLEEIEKIYDQVYDDHNFTFLSGLSIRPVEVEGTHKSVINVAKPDAENLEITIIADPRLRGGAGDAVHALNLFFGLHEKTGLNLKPSRFFPDKT